MHNDIITQLKTSSTLTGLIGSNPIKAFFGDVPSDMKNAQGLRVSISAPYLLFEENDGDSVETLAGRTGTSEFYLQMTAVSDRSLPEARAVYNAARNVIGQAISGTWGSLFVHRSYIGFGQDVSKAPTDGSDKPRFEMAGRLMVIADYDT